MKKYLFLSLIFCQSLLLFASGNPLYEIRGDSPALDANLTQFLHRWREETTLPIAEGNYTRVYLHGEMSNGKNIALTFDDSPDDNQTGKILDILKRYGIKGSFFMIGSPMEEANATVVKRTFDEGHLVLNHSFTHPRLTMKSDEEIIRELHNTSERIEQITGAYPLLSRPPYGSINQRVVNAVNARGYTTILWSLDSLDWALKDKNAIVGNVAANVHPGDIILMHSSSANQSSVDSLPEIIETLMKQGYRFRRIDEMLGLQGYREDF